MKTDLDGLQEEFGFTLIECNIEDDEADFERYRYLIPVLDIEGGPILYPPHNRQGTWQALLPLLTHRHNDGITHDPGF